MAEDALKRMTDAAEMLWMVLANVSGGDWTQQTPEWQEAAARWRDNYFARVSEMESVATVVPPPLVNAPLTPAQAAALVEEIDQKTRAFVERREQARQRLERTGR